MGNFSRLKTDNSEQLIGDVHIYPRTYFNAMDFFGNWDKTSNTTTVHLYMGSWLPDEAKQKLDRRKKWYWKLSKWIWVHIGLQKLKKCITTNLNRKALHNY